MLGFLQKNYCNDMELKSEKSNAMIMRRECTYEGVIEGILEFLLPASLRNQSLQLIVQVLHLFRLGRCLLV